MARVYSSVCVVVADEWLVAAMVERCDIYICVRAATWLESFARGKSRGLMSYR